MRKGINKFDEKERRLERRRNHIEIDVPKRQAMLERKRKWLTTEEEVYYDEDE